MSRQRATARRSGSALLGAGLTLLVFMAMTPGCDEDRTPVAPDQKAKVPPKDGQVKVDVGLPDQAVKDAGLTDQPLTDLPVFDLSPADLATTDLAWKDLPKADLPGLDKPKPDILSPDTCTPKTFYKDSDGDGYGASTGTYLGCSAPSGYVEKSGDCNDTDKTINPDATEQCNKKDDNCNNFIDEGLVLSAYYKDNDGDGYGSTSTIQDCMAPSGFVTVTGDCNDNNIAIYPGAKEECNEVDDNCNGYTDEGLVKKAYFKDYDLDGYGGMAFIQSCSAPTGYVDLPGDCNDYNKTIHPGATEQCNTIDDDCNGVIDDNLTTLTTYKDNDGDGFAAQNALSQKSCKVDVGWTVPVDIDGDGKHDWDCDDSNVTVFPGAPTKCGDGKDNNCDGYIDRLCFTTCSGQWQTGPYKPLYAYGTVAAPVADLNGDGLYEVIVQDTFGFAILDNKGKAYYEWSKQSYNYSRGVAVVADIDDYTTFGVATQTLEVLTGNGSVPRFYKLDGTTVKEYTSTESVYDASRFMARDLNGDGVNEFFTSSWCQATAGTKIFRFDKAKGTIDLVTSVADPDKVCEYTDGRILTDLDADGTPELIFGNGYAQSYTPQYWGGNIYARQFTNMQTLATADACGTTGCFGSKVSTLYGGGTVFLFRIADEIRAQILYFTSNTPNYANPSTYRYWTYSTAGAAKTGSPSTSGTDLWASTTDINRDGITESYGNLVAHQGLFDVDGDGYPDLVYNSGQDLKLALWDNKQGVFKENTGSATKVASTSITVRSLWDIDSDGHLEVISSDTNGNIYCHKLGTATWNKADSLPPHFPLFNRTYQWDNHEPNEGKDLNSDGIPDQVVQVPSALTTKGDFYSYLSSSSDKDYYLIDTAWGASICLTSPKGYAYTLKVYSDKDLWNNTTQAATPDGKPDGLLWEKATAKGGQVCFYGSNVMPPRYGVYKFWIGVESTVTGGYSPYWPYWISAKK